MSSRQSSAKSKINSAHKNGDLSTREAGRDGKLVRKVFDEAWGLSDEVREQLDQVFGEAGVHTRSAVGMAELPFDIATEIEAIFEVTPE